MIRAVITALGLAFLGGVIAILVLIVLTAVGVIQ